MFKTFYKSVHLFFLIVIVFCSVSLTQNSSASAMQEVEARTLSSCLSGLAGEWYDQKGNVILEVKDGYINGCEVIAGFDFAKGDGISSLTFKIMENQGARDMRVSWVLSRNPEDYHQFIVVDKKFIAHRTPEVKYYESVGGIYLGMSDENVLKKYGTPAKLNRQQTLQLCGVNTEAWYYQKNDFLVTFWGNEVDRIIILPNSTMKFDRSGLGISDSSQLYGQKYGVKVYTWGNDAFGVHLENNEHISSFKRSEGILLSIYAN